MLTAANLRCEYAPTPLGIDTPAPRLSWELRPASRGTAPAAYQVRAASTPELLAAGSPDLWDSDRVASTAQLVAYAGPPPRSRQRVWWQVRAWAGDAAPGPWAEPTWFEMGLLHAADWRADWIGFPAGWNGRALTFRRPFRLETPVSRARAYLSGLGYYELRLNGHRIGDHVLDPGTTSYDQRVLYVTYDVTDALRTGAGQDGENMVAVTVGHGWYGAPQLLLQLEITHNDGATTQLLTQSGPWQVGTGPILENSIYDGELYDARLERPGWDMPVGMGADPPPAGQAAPGPGGADTEPTAAWSRPHVTTPPGGRLVAQMLPPIRVTETLAPQSVSEPWPDIFVHDLGQNISGWARLHVEGPPGTRITLRFAESLHPDGTVNQENLRGAAATDVYILKGQGREVWEPRFTYHGFRYIQVEGWSGSPGSLGIEGRVVRSDTAATGQFACSNDLLNRIHHLVWWTEATNQHSIPTDCPQRDERMGWLNDLGARTEEAVYNFDMARFFAKWVADIHDAQDPVTGAITDTAPFRWGSRPADPVSVSYLLIPWTLYLHYGDARTMTAHYSGFRAWVDYLTSRATDHVVSYSYYGDWAPPIDQGREGSAVSASTPGELVSTGYYFYAASLLAQMATALGKADDAAHYSRLAAAIAATFRTRFYDPTTGGYGSNNQACNAFALYLGLVPKPQVAQVVANLVHDVADLHGGHLTTGNLCTKYLLEVLTAHGHADLAYTVATQESYPSWGYMLANGATTIWERWEYATGGAMNSHNHPMYASIGAWFYNAVAGIAPDPEGPGFARFTVRPHPAGDLTHAAASLRTVRGLIESAWQLAGDRFTLQVTVPVGSAARIHIPKPPTGDPFHILEGDRVVWPGDPATSADLGFTAIDEEAAAIVVTAGSGAYTFTREPLRRGPQ
jgi:alpha-L-rhamnosidase